MLLEESSAKGDFGSRDRRHDLDCCSRWFQGHAEVTDVQDRQPVTFIMTKEHIHLMYLTLLQVTDTK